jgi:hypothetical protein
MKIKRSLAEIRRTLRFLKDTRVLGEFITEEQLTQSIHLYIKLSINKPSVLIIPDYELASILTKLRALRREAIWNAKTSGVTFTAIAARMQLSVTTISLDHHRHSRRLIRERGKIENPEIRNEIMALAYAIAVN